MNLVSNNLVLGNNFVPNYGLNFNQNVASQPLFQINGNSYQNYNCMNPNQNMNMFMQMFVNMMNMFSQLLGQGGMQNDFPNDSYADIFGDNNLSFGNTNGVCQNGIQPQGPFSNGISNNALNSNNKIWNQIDPEERKLVEGQDLMAVDEKTGEPKYLIARGSDDKKFHIYKRDSYGTSYDAVKKVEYGNNTIYSPDKKNIRQVGGGFGNMNGSGQNVSANGSFGNNTINAPIEIINIGNGDVNVGSFNGNGNNVNGGAPVQQQGGFYVLDNAETLSPLVVDYNQDGQVSATAGMGVDIDGDGKADGAATGGDKMLAMSDSNGNGSVDGTEVFGNKTVNPFTGEAMNAKNGFEALKQVALSAQQSTGIQCFDGQNVDLKNLQQALKTKGINLGFVSGNNNTQLEDLSKIDKINVTNYKETQQTGDVQHNQQGSGTTQGGSQVKVDDVWFKASK